MVEEETRKKRAKKMPTVSRKKATWVRKKGQKNSGPEKNGGRVNAQQIGKDTRNNIDTFLRPGSWEGEPSLKKLISKKQGKTWGRTEKAFAALWGGRIERFVHSNQDERNGNQRVHKEKKKKIPIHAGERLNIWVITKKRGTAQGTKTNYGKGGAVQFPPIKAGGGKRRKKLGQKNSPAVSACRVGRTQKEMKPRRIKKMEKKKSGRRNGQ